MPNLGWLMAATVVSALIVSSASADADRTSVEAVESLQAYALYKSGQYEKALELWKALAERGNTTAMTNLANMYEQGQGVERDTAAAAEWLRRAAELGDRVAQLNLGLAFERGTGVERDNREAARWFRRAAEQGDVDAQFNLGVMLATAYGDGADKATAADREEAVTWLEKAAAQNHPEARGFLQLLGR